MNLLTESALTADGLSRLLSGRALALRIASYANAELCQRLASWLANHDGRRPYDHEIHEHGTIRYAYYGVDRVGTPFNSVLTAASDSTARQQYYADALPQIRQVRAAAAPYLSPIDKLRLELDEVWPAGALLARFEEKPMFVGIARIMNAATSVSSELYPHVDGLPATIFPLVEQLAANIYLEVPPTGAELEIWAQFGWIDGRSHVPVGRPDVPPTLVVRPAVGDLVIFNARRLHAIHRFDTGVRTTLQGFIGYAGDGPLLLWD
ncbi:MAG TPA: 2OG-Fe(II) oxygenase [Thermoanaerobaculia bacterium]|nr:2OG-Fe(II) oxygenase [Thermoanaerobaculia bacterium]